MTKLLGLLLLFGFVVALLAFIVCGVTRCPKCGGWHEENEDCNQ